MTISEAMRELEAWKPHKAESGQICKWLEELDRRVLSEVMKFGHTTLGVIRYRYPECANYELLLEAPHDSVYGYWLAFKIDMMNGETDKAINSGDLYNEHWSSFAAWFQNMYHPGAGYSWIEPLRNFR